MMGRPVHSTRNLVKHGPCSVKKWKIKREVFARDEKKKEKNECGCRWKHFIFACDSFGECWNVEQQQQNKKQERNEKYFYVFCFFDGIIQDKIWLCIVYENVPLRLTRWYSASTRLAESTEMKRWDNVIYGFLEQILMIKRNCSSTREHAVFGFSAHFRC